MIKWNHELQPLILTLNSNHKLKPLISVNKTIKGDYSLWATIATIRWNYSLQQFIATIHHNHSQIQYMYRHCSLQLHSLHSEYRAFGSPLRHEDSLIGRNPTMQPACIDLLEVVGGGA